MTGQLTNPAVAPTAWRVALVSVLTAVLLAGCASPTHRAPVEDRKPGDKVPAAAPAAPASAATAATPAPEAPPPKPLPGAENAGKPGYYTVKPGDTLIRIGLENGQNWRDIARWSALENPNIIEVGQVLRVVPPTADANGVSVRPVAPAGVVVTRPLDGRPVAAVGAASAASAAASAPATPAPAKDSEEDLAWVWPASGTVATAFDEGKRIGSRSSRSTSKRRAWRARAGGEGEGKVVFIEGACPGERVQVSVSAQERTTGSRAR
jgi:lipoprotein NlpD